MCKELKPEVKDYEWEKFNDDMDKIERSITIIDFDRIVGELNEAVTCFGTMTGDVATASNLLSVVKRRVHEKAGVK